MHNYIYYKIFELLSQTGYNELIMNEFWRVYLWHLMGSQLQT